VAWVRRRINYRKTQYKARMGEFKAVYGTISAVYVGAVLKI
jgi:hypothetical protein